MARRKQAAHPSTLLVADRDPTKPPNYVAADVLAFKALQAGEANEHQQQRALRWIIEGAADYYGMSYRRGDSDGTAFAEGRRFVGQQVVKMVNYPPAALDALRQKEAAEEQAAKDQQAKVSK